MLKSRYHAIFLGKTPWSLLHASILSQRGKDVLVIDDQSLAVATGGHRWLTLLEIEALLSLAEKFHVEELKALDAFIKPAQIKIQTPRFQWVSGLEVRDNLREFVRKFPCFQTPILLEALEKADVTGDLLKVQKSFLEWFVSPQARSRATAPFVAQGVGWFLEFQRLLTEELSKSYEKPGDGALSQLVAAYHCATSQVVKYNFCAHEAAYISMRLLSPLKELDERWFEREIIRGMTEQGAHLKRTGVQSWQIWDSRVEAILLSSYEGVIGHDRLLLYGFPPDVSALKCEMNQRVFRGLETQWQEAFKPIVEEPIAEMVCLTETSMMGTDMPIMVLESGQKNTRLQVLVEERPGAKPDFYRAEAQSLAHGMVRSAITQTEEWWARDKKVNNWDIWVEEAVARPSRGQIELHEKRSIDIIERETGEKLSGVRYWGPLMTQRFGVLGYLAELRWDSMV